MNEYEQAREAGDRHLTVARFAGFLMMFEQLSWGLRPRL
jgi:hypothetical protein